MKNDSRNTLLVGLVLFTFLEILFWKPDFFIWLGPLIFFGNLFWGYFYFKKWKYLILPSISLVSSFLFLPLFSGVVSSHFLILLIIGLIFLIYLNLEKLVKKTGFGLDLHYILSFAIFFIFSAGIFSLAENLILKPAWVIPALVLGASFLSIDLFRGIKIKPLYILIAIFILAESSWALLFWPFSYLTEASILLIIYYTLWQVLRDFSQNRLGWQIAIKNAILLLVFIAIVLAFTPWLPK